MKHRSGVMEKEVDDKVLLGRQKFHAKKDGAWFQDSNEIIAMNPQWGTLGEKTHGIFP